MHQQVEPLPGELRVVGGHRLLGRGLYPLHHFWIGLCPAGGDQLQGDDPFRVVGGIDPADPSAEGFPGDVDPVDAEGVDDIGQMLDVLGDLVVVVRLAGVAVTQHVDGMASVAGIDMGHEVPGERFEVAAGSMEEHDVRALTG